jgi:hypothetical protein
MLAHALPGACSIAEANGLQNLRVLVDRTLGTPRNVVDGPQGALQRGPDRLHHVQRHAIAGGGGDCQVKA